MKNWVQRTEPGKGVTVKEGQKEKKEERESKNSMDRMKILNSVRNAESEKKLHEEQL